VLKANNPSQNLRTYIKLQVYKRVRKTNSVAIFTIEDQQQMVSQRSLICLYLFQTKKVVLSLKFTFASISDNVYLKFHGGTFLLQILGNQDQILDILCNQDY